MMMAVTKKVMEVFLNLSFLLDTKNHGACRTSTLKSLQQHFFIVKNLIGQRSRFFIKGICCLMTLVHLLCQNIDTEKTVF